MSKFDESYLDPNAPKSDLVREPKQRVVLTGGINWEQERDDDDDDMPSCLPPFAWRGDRRG